MEETVGQIGQIVEVQNGNATVRIQLTRPAHTGVRGYWHVPGYRWIKSRGAFSKTALIHGFDTRPAVVA